MQIHGETAGAQGKRGWHLTTSARASTWRKVASSRSKSNPPSAAVGADQADAYTRLVSAGEDLLTESVPTIPSRREIWITADPLSAEGAQHLRDLGTRFVVMPPELFESTIRTLREPSRMLESAVGVERPGTAGDRRGAR